MGSNASGSKVRGSAVGGSAASGLGLRGTGPRGSGAGGSGAGRGSQARRRRQGAETLSVQALELVAQRFRALGDPSRLALLQALMDGERTVGELCLVCPTSQANVSRHLAMLHEEGLLSRRKDGQHVHYKIADPSIAKLCELVCGSLSRRLDGLREELPSA